MDRRRDTTLTDPTAWSEAVAREAVIRPLALADLLTRGDIALACRALGLKRTRLYELVDRYRARPVTSSLLPGRPGSRPGARRLPDEVEKIIATAIRTTYTHRPVVVAQVPPEPVERDLYRELLAALQAPALVGGPVAREKDVCRSRLRTVGARMIILDEVNGMLAGTFRQQRVFLNALQFLANDLKAPLVCAGTDLARQALLTDPQLAERFEALHLARWRNDRVFGRLLKSLGRASSAWCAVTACTCSGCATGTTS